MAPLGHWTRTVNTTDLDTVKLQAQEFSFLVSHLSNIRRRDVELLAEWFICHLGMVNGGDVLLLRFLRSESKDVFWVELSSIELVDLRVAEVVAEVVTEGVTVVGVVEAVDVVTAVTAHAGDARGSRSRP